MVKANEGLSTNQISEERIPSSTNQYNIYIYTHVFLYLYIYNIYYEPHCVYIYIYIWNVTSSRVSPTVAITLPVVSCMGFCPLLYPVVEGPCWVIL